MSHSPWEIENRREQIKALEKERKRVQDWKINHMKELAGEQKKAKAAMAEIKARRRKAPKK